MPFAQKKFAGQVTFWHWLATVCELGMLQVPSDWQTLPPPPQSPSRWHFAPVPAPQVPPGQFRSLPLPQAATSATASSPNSPLAIPHPPPAQGAGGQEVGMGEAGGNRPNGGPCFGA